jgi:hypothetical protein
VCVYIQCVRGWLSRTLTLSLTHSLTHSLTLVLCMYVAVNRQKPGKRCSSRDDHDLDKLLDATRSGDVHVLYCTARDTYWYRCLQAKCPHDE